MDYPKIILSIQKEESISMQRVKVSKDEEFEKYLYIFLTIIYFDSYFSDCCWFW